ncbi:MAG: peptide chain release factor N(5)-glutamine methyltransferase [Terracidiphilus sp.]
MTLRDFLGYGESQLSASPHPDRAKRDAETLLLHLIGKNKAWLMAHASDDFAGCTAIRYAGLLERRRKGEPIQYITGETEFYGLPFRVTPDVLIPRPETEHLVEKVVRLIPALDRRPKKVFSIRKTHPAFRDGERTQREGDPDQISWPPRVLDVGTGSGCIAISIAHDWGEADITAVDSSASALEVARSNSEKLGFAECIRFLQGDLLAPVAEERFEIVVSNPPYVPTVDRDSLSVEVRDHEPALALFAGNDGLDIYSRLIPQAFAALVPGGFIALEIGYAQQPAIHSLLATAGFTDIQFAPDLQGIPRVAIARRP